MNLTESYNKDKMVERRPVILYGGSMYGEMAFQVIQNLYHGKVDYIVDNKFKEISWADVPVIRSTGLKEIKNADVLICAAGSFESVRKEAETYRAQGIRVWDLREILSDFMRVFSTKIKNGGGILDSYLYGDLDFDEIIMRYRYYAGEDNGYDKKIYLPYCVLCVTSKCSLKCRNCAAFIPRYNPQRDYSREEIVVNFSKILSALDGIMELELMGGEPFLCRDFNQILQWCLGQEKIRAVKIVTNGTVVPAADTWNLLRHNKVKLVIDDYGSLSGNLHKLAELAERNHVRCEIQKLQTWLQIEPVCRKHYGEEKLKDIFEGCNFRTCIGMTEGRLYHCNVAGHMNTVGLLADEASDFIELRDIDWESGELRRELVKFMNLKYLKACDYCNLCNKVEIPVAEQV